MLVGLLHSTSASSTHVYDPREKPMDAYTTLGESSYTQALLERLTERHLAGMSQPDNNGPPLSAWLLQQLFHSILTEGYGE